MPPKLLNQPLRALNGFLLVNHLPRLDHRMRHQRPKNLHQPRARRLPQMRLIRRAVGIQPGIHEPRLRRQLMEILGGIPTQTELLDRVDDNLPHFHVDGGRVVRAEGGGVAVVPLEVAAWFCRRLSYRTKVQGNCKEKGRKESKTRLTQKIVQIAHRPRIIHLLQGADEQPHVHEIVPSPVLLWEWL
ncbi:hypothetical protein GB937_003329 [Aspergillus fischeri]|nr:hypothetical protein GB937_003329 [Aspergillus fischeri]